MNCLRLSRDPEKGFFTYEVTFNPPVDNVSFRYKCVQQLEGILGKFRTFDGVQLSLPLKLQKRVSQSLLCH